MSAPRIFGRPMRRFWYGWRFVSKQHGVDVELIASGSNRWHSRTNLPQGWLVASKESSSAELAALEVEDSLRELGAVVRSLFKKLPRKRRR